jgi:cytoskeleton-associated protein 5
MKLKKPAGDALMSFGEKTSLQFVLGHGKVQLYLGKSITYTRPAYDPLSKQKAPKVLADAIAWIDTALTEFGIAGLSLRSLIEFLKTGLKNSNAAVRTSATKTLVTVKLFAGPSKLSSFFIIILAYQLYLYRRQGPLGRPQSSADDHYPCGV